MRAQSLILNLIAAVIATSATVIASAQEPQKQLPEKRAASAQDNQPGAKKKDDVICELRIETYLPSINISITDSDNQPITNIGHEDVAIFEDDVKQGIAYWSNDNSPVNFSLAFDISDYAPLKLMARQTASRLVRQISSTDYVAVPQLKTDKETVRDFAADERKLENALSGISSKKRLADVVGEAIESEGEKNKVLRDVVIVITDCLSMSSDSSDRDAAYAILRRTRPLYFIILDDARSGSRPAVQSRVRQARYLLTRLAEVSGGLALVVKNENEISSAAEQIIQRVKNEYVAAYVPTNQRFDGSFRYIRVIVTPKDKRKVKVFAPSGYYAVDPEKIR
jgi:VWFA-related protein